MTYMCIVNISAGKFYDSNYKNILLCEDKEFLEAKIEEDKEHPNTPSTWTNLAEYDEPLSEFKDKLVQKLVSTGYKVVYKGYLFAGPAKDNIYKISVKAEE